jgi:predicted acetyltransferase
LLLLLLVELFVGVVVLVLLFDRALDGVGVEVVADVENKKSQRVIEKSNGRFIETFTKPKHLAQTLSNRYRIYL